MTPTRKKTNLRLEYEIEVDVSTTTARLHKLDAVSQRLGIGRTALYGLINSGQLRSVKIGKSRLVPESAIVEFIERLEASATGDRPGAA